MMNNKDLTRLIDDYLSCESDTCRRSDASCNDSAIVCGDQAFQEMTSLSKALEIACRSRMKNGKRHGHQRRIPKLVLAELENELKRNWRDKIQSCQSFEELHGIIELVGTQIRGVGPLLVYDVADRIGKGFLGLRPEVVYLHAGAAEGARKLGVAGRKVSLGIFPRPLRRLTCSQAEDFLCVYKRKL